MVPAEHESLLYFRRFPNSCGYGSIHHLFGSTNCKSGFFPGSEYQPIQWEYPQEFASIDYPEPLECVHARRAAFGGSDIRIDAESITPDRSLLSARQGYTMDSYGHVLLDWHAVGVMEVPQFCISSASADLSRVKWGLGPHKIEVLNAALTLSPRELDVFGFSVQGKGVLGAAEFTGARTNAFFDVHLFTTSGDSGIAVGDELWGWYTCAIGETRIEAKRLLAVVANVPGLPVPPLERLDCG